MDMSPFGKNQNTLFERCVDLMFFENLEVILYDYLKEVVAGY